MTPSLVSRRVWPMILLLCGSLSGCALRPGAVRDLITAPDARLALVQTTDGPVQGVRSPRGEAFLGIPFAAPPVGAFRFAPPEPPVPWTAVRDATKPGDLCVQPSVPGAGRQSEDCLTLNIYAPPGAVAGQALPVMVWIYGGGFAIGDNVQYDPSRLAQRQGVIVVAPNYRLGALGFLAHPGLRGTGEGAYALLDQQAALRWVRDNIAGFGGDPRNVTLFGESAGAWSVCYQMTAPGAQGLFQHAILESGACTSPDSAIAMADAEAGGLALASAVGCGDPATAAECLRRLPTRTLQKAKADRRGLLGLDSWSPAFGGEVLPQKPKTAFEDGHFAAIPVIDGTNHDEGRLFLDVNHLKGELWTEASYEKIVNDFFLDQTPKVLAEYADEAKHARGLAYADIVTDSTFACPALTLNALLERRAKVFAYEFDDPNAVFSLPRTPFTPPLKAYHSSEIAYVMQTRWAAADPAKFDAAQQVLSDRMQGYWVSFARTGDPATAGAPPWPMDAGQGPLTLAPAGIAPDPGFAAKHRCAFWAALGY